MARYVLEGPGEDRTSSKATCHGKLRRPAGFRPTSNVRVRAETETESNPRPSLSASSMPLSTASNDPFAGDVASQNGPA